MRLVIGRRAAFCNAGSPGSSGADRVAATDRAVLEDVGADSASVDEFSEDRPRGIALNHGARLAQSHASTAHFAYRELVLNQPIQVDGSRDEVAAVLVGSKRPLRQGSSIHDACAPLCARSSSQMWLLPGMESAGLD